MSPSAQTRPSPSSGFPRVSGDEPYTSMEAAFNVKFSPRERG